MMGECNLCSSLSQRCKLDLRSSLCTDQLSSLTQRNSLGAQEGCRAVDCWFGHLNSGEGKFKCYSIQRHPIQLCVSGFVAAVWYECNVQGPWTCVHLVYFIICSNKLLQLCRCLAALCFEQHPTPLL